jgi:DNA polymerase III subunit delta'
MNQFWDSIYEQNSVKKQLFSICNSGRIPHALIFSGLPGVGKFNSAIQFAKYFISVHSPKSSHFLIEKIQNLQEPYIKIIFPLPRGKNEGPEDSPLDKLTPSVIQEMREAIVSKISNPYCILGIENANTIKINSIREIGKFINISSDYNVIRFIIIHDSHMMNENAQNALLKNLEEPPEGIIFILLTSRIHQLLPTIISRCRVFEFEPLSSKSIVSILYEKFGIEPIIAERVSHFAEGSVESALELLSLDLENILPRTIVILRNALGKKYFNALQEILTFVDQFSEEALIFLIRLIKIWFIDLYKIRYSSNDIIFKEHIETLTKFNDRYPTIQLDQIVNFLDSLELLINKNMNLNVIYVNLIFEIAAVVRRKL